MLKKYSRISAVTVAALMIVMMLSGCGAGGALKPPAMKEGAVAVKVTGSCELTVEGDTITVSGETSLLPGSIVRVSVESQSGMTLDSVNIPIEDKKISREFKITADKYDASVVSVTGHITCAPRIYGTQSDAVYEKYGSKFENITPDGKNVLWDSNGNFVIFASDTIELK